MIRSNTKGDKRRAAALRRNLSLKRRASTTLDEATIKAAAKLINEANLKAAATKDLKSCYSYYLDNEAEEYLYDNDDYLSGDDVEEHFFELMDGDHFVDFTEEVGSIVYDAVERATDGKVEPLYDDDYVAVINEVTGYKYESTTQYVAQEGDYGVVSAMSRYVERLADEANEEMSGWEDERKSLEREYYDSVMPRSSSVSKLRSLRRAAETRHKTRRPRRRQ